MSRQSLKLQITKCGFIKSYFWTIEDVLSFNVGFLQYNDLLLRDQEIFGFSDNNGTFKCNMETTLLVKLQTSTSQMR